MARSEPAEWEIPANDRLKARLAWARVVAANTIKAHNLQFVPEKSSR